MSVFDNIENIVRRGMPNDKGEIIDDFSFGSMGVRFSYMIHYNFSFLEFFSKEELISWFWENGWEI